jgi:hypothetical protein
MDAMTLGRSDLKGTMCVRDEVMEEEADLGNDLG